MRTHRRFYVEPNRIADDLVELGQVASRQITRVLRLHKGDAIQFFDGSGTEYDAEIARITRGTVSARVTSRRECPNEPGLRLTLALCLPKSYKPDLIIGRCTELGVSEFMIVAGERTVPRPDEKRISGRLARWGRIAVEAAEQSGRGRIPVIRGIVPFHQLGLEIGRYGLAMVAWENETGSSLRDVLRASSGAKSVLLLLGPEGGLTQGEVDLAVSAGAKAVSLGRRLLRVETAAIAACAAVMYEFEDQL